jgi:hypothetical protein
MIKAIKTYLRNKKEVAFDQHLFETMDDTGPGTTDMIVNAMKWGKGEPSPHFIRKSLGRLECAGKIRKGELDMWYVSE